MPLTIYSLKTCDTCRKAIKALTAAGHDLTIIDVRADGVKPSDLATWCDALGFEAVLNTRSTTWRALSETDKADMTASKAAALMGQHPTLIKRPIIVRDNGTVTAGWTKPVQSELIP